MSDYQKGLLITVCGVLLVTPDSLFVRLIETPPMAIAFWRSAVSGILILCFLLLFEGRSSFRVLFQMGIMGWVYCFLIGSTSPAFVLAVENTSVANVVFIFAAIPVFAAIYSRLFLGEHISTRLAITMIAVAFGLSVIAYGSSENEIAHWSGDLFALYIALAYAGALTILRGLKDISMVPAIPIGYLGSALLLGMTVDPMKGFAENFGLYLAHGACIAAATACLTIGPRYISSPEVSLLILLESVLAPILVWVALSEHPGQWAILGGIIVIGALLVSNVYVYLKSARLKR